MRMKKLNYFFKIRDVQSTAFHIGVIYNNLGYVTTDKSNILKAFGLTNDQLKDNKYYLRDIREAVERVYNDKLLDMNDKCADLQERWNNIKEYFMSIVSQVLDIQFDATTHNTMCYLNLLPINEVVPENSTLYLDYNETNDELFANFIVLLVKNLIINRWRQNDNLVFSSSYEAETRTWLFVEIAIDAIFYNSELSEFCSEPSYKYFYSLKVNNINFINEFRKLFPKVHIIDFLNEVYVFVHEHFDDLIKFKNYLY